VRAEEKPAVAIVARKRGNARGAKGRRNQAEKRGRIFLLANLECRPVTQ